MLRTEISKMENECSVCMDKKLTLDTAINWLECPHSVCRDCFVKLAVVYSFENQSVKIECPICRADINRLTEGSELITVDLWTKMFRTVRRKKCKTCGEKDAPTPVVTGIDNCKIHQEVCLNCGIKTECDPPGCFFLKCPVCKKEETYPKFCGLFLLWCVSRACQGCKDT